MEKSAKEDTQIRSLRMTVKISILEIQTNSHSSKKLKCSYTDDVTYYNRHSNNSDSEVNITNLGSPRSQFEEISSLRNIAPKIKVQSEQIHFEIVQKILISLIGR